MQDWRRCKRKWWIRYHRRLTPVSEGLPGGALWVGNLVHDTLAMFYDGEEHHIGELGWMFEGQVGKLCEADPVLADQIRKEAELPRLMIEGYGEWLQESGADSELVVLGSERYVEVLMDDELTLLSKLDAPVFRVSDGAKLALEHKTVGNFKDVDNTSKLNTQFLTEHLVRFLDAMENGSTADEAMADCQGILLNMLKKVKRTARATPPFYAREPIYHNINELRNHWRHVFAISKEIRDAHNRLDGGESHHTVVPPNPTKDCSWDCPLFHVCVMADDGSDFEGALEGMFEAKDPLARYDDALAMQTEGGTK